MKQISLIILISLLAGNIYCQQPSICEALKKMLTPESTEAYLSKSIDSSVIVIIDKSNDFSSCEIPKWQNKEVHILYDTAISGKLKKSSAYFTFRNRCQFFVVNYLEKKGNSLVIVLLQACSGQSVSGKFRLKKGAYVLASATKGVF
jgi:hypothetical protein